MKRIIKTLTIFLLVGVFLTSAASAAEAGEIKRLFGGSRVHTSLEISKEAYDQAETVVLVGYNGEVDALTGSLFARAKDAPVIFAHENFLGDIKKTLESLNTKKVYVLGGESVFSKKLLEKFKAYNPTRINGNNRFETGVSIAKEAIGETSDEAFLALGLDVYADALAIGPVAADQAKPLLLTGKKALPRATKEALVSMGVKKVDIIGGKVAVPEAIEEELKALGIRINRIRGDSRELTAIAIAQEFNRDPEKIVVANGWNFADAVAGGYFAAKSEGVLLLTNTARISDDVLSYVERNPRDIFVLGGSTVIDPGVITKFAASSGNSIVVDSLNVLEIHALTDEDSIFLKFDREIDFSKLSVDIQVDSQAIEGKISSIDNSTGIRIKMDRGLEVGSYDIALSGLTASPVDFGLEVRDILSRGVENKGQLRAALGDKAIEEIVLLKDIKLREALVLDRSVTLEGNKKTVSTSQKSLYDSDDDYLKGLLTVTSNNVTLKNLNIESRVEQNLLFHRVKNALLKDLRVRDASSTNIAIFSSEVKAEDITTISDGFAIGIQLSNDYYDSSSGEIKFYDDSKLTIVGSHNHRPRNSATNLAVFLIGEDESIKNWLVGGDYKLVKKEALGDELYTYSFNVK